LRDQLLTILNAAALSEMDTAIQRSAELADQILNGIDINENGSIEAVAGECGVLAAYQAVYHMADMPLLPINPLDTPTPEAGPGTPSATSALTRVASPTPRGGGSSTNVPTRTATNQPPNLPTNPPPNPPTNGPPNQPTREPRPTREPKPTKEPRPTNEHGPNNSP
jgi:outer membrane biosynthesis protein TonB